LLVILLLLLPLAPQLLVKPWPPPKSSSIYPSPMPTQLIIPGSSIWPNFLEASKHCFYRVGLLAPRPTPTLEDQASVFISPRGRVAREVPQCFFSVTSPLPYFYLAKSESVSLNSFDVTNEIPSLETSVLSLLGCL
jgi:hypothetical protein